jgi:hypothetical protein
MNLKICKLIIVKPLWREAPTVRRPQAGEAAGGRQVGGWTLFWCIHPHEIGLNLFAHIREIIWSSQNWGCLFWASHSYAFSIISMFAMWREINQVLYCTLHPHHLWPIQMWRHTTEFGTIFYTPPPQTKFFFIRITWRHTTQFGASFFIIITKATNKF